MTELNEHGATPESPESPEEFWEDFYGERKAKWSGEPNPLLVREVAGLTAGTVLDLGCGEGADAIWLAGRGWRVTAVDISDTALRRGMARAAEVGVGEKITWERHNLFRTFPEGSFDLVSAQFLHSPVAVPDERETILRNAAGAVAPGGRLLIVSHAGWPTWHEHPEDVHFPTIQEMLDTLDLSPEHWRVEVTELVEREISGPEGQQGTRGDTVLRIKRLDQRSSSLTSS